MIFSLRHFLYEDETRENLQLGSLRQRFLEMAQTGGMFAEEAVKELRLHPFNEKGGRLVYDLQDGTVLKIKDPYANKQEAKAIKCLEDAGIETIAPKLYEYDEHGDWLIMERVKPLNKNELIEVFPKYFDGIVLEPYENNFFIADLFRWLIETKGDTTKVDVKHVFDEYSLPNSNPTRAFKTLAANPIIQKLIEVIRVCPFVSYKDFNGENWGISSTGHLVILDWGYQDYE